MNAIEIRSLTAADVDGIVGAFEAVGWPGKTVEQYRRYVGEQAAGRRAVRVAHLAGGFAGYVTVAWTSRYPPFRDAGIPEINDLNVLPGLRGRGVGSALMDAVERAIAPRSPVAGVGVGLYADYAAAHRMYLRRGYRPDGRGLIYRNTVAGPGTTVRVDDDLVIMMTRHLVPVSTSDGPGLGRRQLAAPGVGRSPPTASVTEPSD